MSLTNLTIFKEIATQQAPKPKGRSFPLSLRINAATAARQIKQKVHKCYSWFKAHKHTMASSSAKLV